ISTEISSLIEDKDSESPDEIEKEIYNLPLEERQVFMMHVNAGLGFRQISKIMDISIPAAYRKYKKATKTLRQALEGGDYNE
ncbi:MAG: hypothetical protein II487_03700, partial [Schwartzia sp.]|nr:hypothetical protein [Schwartzia sp. (in: firmicutes)]